MNLSLEETIRAAILAYHNKDGGDIPLVERIETAIRLQFDVRRRDVWVQPYQIFEHE